MKLGTKIKEVRKKKGFTQLDLSEKSGLSLRTIHKHSVNKCWSGLSFPLTLPNYLEGI